MKRSRRVLYVGFWFGMVGMLGIVLWFAHSYRDMPAGQEFPTTSEGVMASGQAVAVSHDSARTQDLSKGSGGSKSDYFLEMAKSDPNSFLAYLRANRTDLCWSAEIGPAIKRCFESLGPEVFAKWVTTCLNSYDASSRILCQRSVAFIADYPLPSPGISFLLESVCATGHSLLLTGYFEQISGRNALAAAELIRSLGISSFDKAALSEPVVSRLAATDPSAAWKLLGELDIGNCPAALATSFGSLFEANRNMAMEKLGEMPSNAVLAVVESNVGALISSGFSSRMLEILSRIPIISANLGSYNSAIAKIAASGVPPETILNGLGGDLPASTLTAVFRNASGTGVDKLIALSNTLQDESKRRAASVGISDRLMAQDIDLGIAFAKDNGTPEVLGNVADQMITRAGKASLVLVDDPIFISKIDPDDRGRMLERIVYGWAAGNELQVVSWLDSRPEQEQSSITRGLMKRWIESDPVAASDWLSKQPLGPARDAGARVLIEQIKDTDPERAEVWRKAMSSPEAK